MSYSAPKPGRHTHNISTFSDPPGHNAGSGSAVYPTADLALYVPVLVHQPVTVMKLGVQNGTVVSGNFDVGLYTAGGTRLVSTGATAQAGISTLQVLDVTDTLISPGLYYLAVVLDNVVGRLLRNSEPAPIPAAKGELAEQLSAAGTLPASATFTVPQTVAYWPFVVMLVEATVA